MLRCLRISAPGPAAARSCGPSFDRIKGGSQLVVIAYVKKPTLAHHELGAETLRQWRNDHAEFVAKCVCGNCNSGWMGIIENEAKPYCDKADPGGKTLGLGRP